MNEVERPADGKWSATVSANLVHKLAPMLEFGCRTITSCLHFEKTHDGAIVFATNGHSLAAVFDPETKATASASVQVPKRLLKSCRPPKLPQFHLEGDEVDLSEISFLSCLYPDKCLFTGVSWHVWPNARKVDGEKEILGEVGGGIRDSGNIFRPGRDYRVYDALLPNWRKALKLDAARSAPVLPGRIDPKVLGQFRRFACGNGILLSPPDISADPWLVRIAGDDQFIGAVMPMRACDAPTIPAWAKETP